MVQKRKQAKAFKQKAESLKEELLLIAEEYGLEVDKDEDSNSNDINNKTYQEQVTSIDEQEDKTPYDTDWLINTIVPRLYSITKCSFPGCDCNINGKKLNCTRPSKNLKLHLCPTCQHRLPLHQLELSSNSHNRSQYLLQDLFNLIRLGRISSTVFMSKNWIDSVLMSLESLETNNKNINKNECKNNFNSLFYEIELLRRKCLQIRSSTKLKECIIRFAIYFDQMYYHTYYAFLQEQTLPSSFIIPAPVNYFLDLEEYHSIQDKTKDINIVKTEEERNELLILYRCRVKETIRFFSHDKIGKNGEIDKILNKKTLTKNIKKKEKIRKKISNDLIPMPCYDLLQEWRDNCRDWACHLYSYAIPNKESLDILTEYQPLIELGAGTGYWTSLLLKQKVDIIAFDKDPTTEGNHNKFTNEYHGKALSFCSVQKGRSDILRQHPARNLFLCYPPPNDSMARDCLKYFTAQYLLYVGEWNGDTADRQFEWELCQNFVLIRKISLLNWSNTCYDLKIWKRKDERKKESFSLSPIECNSCGKTSSLKRCLLCKTFSFCSVKCELLSRTKHIQEHENRMIFLKQQINFNSLLQFSPLEDLSTLTFQKDFLSSKIEWSQEHQQNSFKFFPTKEEILITN